MAYLINVFYKNDLHSDSEAQQYIFSLIPWVLPNSLHLLPVLFCNHNVCAAASDVTDVTTPNWFIWLAKF